MYVIDSLRATVLSYVGRLNPRYRSVPARLDQSYARTCREYATRQVASALLFFRSAHAIDRMQRMGLMIQAMARPNCATILPFDLHYLFDQEVFSRVYQVKELAQ